jgi:hypothetical protein
MRTHWLLAKKGFPFAISLEESEKKLEESERMAASTGD